MKLGEAPFNIFGSKSGDWRWVRSAEVGLSITHQSQKGNRGITCGENINTGRKYNKIMVKICSGKAGQCVLIL